jgi:hypothetical protein
MMSSATWREFMMKVCVVWMGIGRIGNLPCVSLTVKTLSLGSLNAENRPDRSQVPA